MSQRATQFDHARQIAIDKYGAVIPDRSGRFRRNQPPPDTYDTKPLRERNTEPVQAVKPLKIQNKYILMAKGIVVMAILLVVGPYTVHIVQQKVDDVKYGMPRTMQVDAIVGHSDSKESPSHFIAENLHGQILVIELPGGKSKGSNVYFGPNVNDETIVPELSFADLNRDGKLDMKVRLQSAIWISLNDGQQFSTKQIPIESLQKM